MAGARPAAALRLDDPASLDARAVLAIARGELAPSLSDDLARRLDERRAAMLAALERGEPVYGVTTGMGALERPTSYPPARARPVRGAHDGAVGRRPAVAQPGRDARGPRRPAADVPQR